MISGLNGRGQNDPRPGRGALWLMGRRGPCWPPGLTAESLLPSAVTGDSKRKVAWPRAPRREVPWVNGDACCC